MYILQFRLEVTEPAMSQLGNCSGKFFRTIYDALHHLVPFVQFKKHEKQPWRSVNFSKVVG